MPVIDQSDADVIRIKVVEKSLQGEASVDLKILCKERLAEKVRDIHFDMAEVKYMDSASIGTLLFIIQMLKKEQKKVTLDAASPELCQLFRSLLLDQFLVLPEAAP